MPSTLISTGIPLLDDALGGGLEQGSATVYWSDKEVEGSSLALQTLYNRLKEGDAGVAVATTKKPRQVLEAMRDLGFDPAIHPVLVDAFTAIYEGKSEEKFFLKSPNDADEMIAVVRNALKSNKGRHTLLVFDSFSAYIDRFEPVSRGVEIVSRVVQLFKENNATGIFVFNEWTYESDLLNKVREAFDVVVKLETTPQRPIYSMQVSKRLTPGPAETRQIFFKVLRPGGVKIHLPKVLVAGPFHAGKSSFIHTASTHAVSADRLGTTVALDYAHVEHKGFVIDLFGAPGQTRFSPLLEPLGGQALGVILVVSATDRQGLSQVRDQIRFAKVEGLPYVVAVNKINLRGAISLSALRNLLKVPARVPVIPMRAKNLTEVRPNQPCQLNRQDVEKVLDTIVEQISRAEKVGKK